MISRFSVLLTVAVLAAAPPVLAETKAGDVKAGDAKADPKAAKPPLDLVNAKIDVDPAAAILKANVWFNGANTMVGDFVQVGPDGRRSEGKIYVQRPGRLRFEYAQPATMEIIADGTSVVLRDRKLGTQDNYFLAQTPLKFLLKDKIDLSRDVKVLDVSGDPKTTSIFVEDKATFGGTSRIKLMFDTKTFALKQWQVTDPQGYDTLVSLFNIDLGTKPDPSLFKISQERFINPN
jgi:outer membrane lipoprotein-sorting protein